MEPFDVDGFPQDSEISQMFDSTLIVKIPASFIYQISETQDVLSIKIKGVKLGLTHLKGASYISEGFTTAMIVFEKPSNIPEVMQIHEALSPLASDSGMYSRRSLLEKVLTSSANDELIQECFQIIRSKTTNTVQERSDRGRPPPYSRGPQPPYRAAIRPRPQAGWRAPSTSNTPSQPLPFTVPVPLPLEPQRALRSTPYDLNIPPPPPLTYNGPNNVPNTTDLVVNPKMDLSRQPQHRAMPRLAPQQRAVVPRASQPSATVTQQHAWEYPWDPTDANSGASSGFQFEPSNAAATQNLTIQNFRIQQNIYENQGMHRRDAPQGMHRRDAPPPYELSIMHSGRNNAYPGNQMQMQERMAMNRSLNQPSTNYYGPAHSEYNGIKYSPQQHFQAPPDCGQHFASPRGMMLPETIRNDQFTENDVYGTHPYQNMFANECGGHINHNGDFGNRNGYAPPPMRHTAIVAQERVHRGGFKPDDSSDIAYRHVFKKDQFGVNVVNPQLPDIEYNGSSYRNGDFGNRNGHVTSTRYPAITAEERTPDGGFKHDDFSDIFFHQLFKTEQSGVIETNPGVSEPSLNNEQRVDLSQKEDQDATMEITADELKKILGSFEE